MRTLKQHLAFTLDAMSGITTLSFFQCRAPLHEKCPQHHGHKGDPGVTHGTCGTIGERALVISVDGGGAEH